MPPWLKYYWSVLVGAHTFSREKVEGLMFLLGEIVALATLFGPDLPGGWGDWFDLYLTRHPRVPWMIAGTLFLVAVGRENWRRVKGQEAEIARLNQQADRRYNLVCELSDVAADLVVRGHTELPQGHDSIQKWRDDHRFFLRRMDQELFPLLLRSQRHRLRVVRNKPGVHTWVKAPPMTQDDFDAYRALDSTWDELRALMAALEPKGKTG